MGQYTIVNLFGDMFNGIGKFFGFIGDSFKFILTLFGNTVDYICSVFGISSFGFQCLIGGLLCVALSIIPDLICYFGCRLSKKYKGLKTKEEKKEYLSRHIHFIFKDVLSLKNTIVKFFGSLYGKKKNKKKSNDVVDSDILVDDIDDIDNEKIENDSVEINNNDISDNIKILYSSNVIGKMLRNGTVLDRRFLVADKPVLVDFTNEPKEVFTGHLCDKDSGISYRKVLNGKSLDMFLDDPEFLNNLKLYDELNIDELMLLKEELLNDLNYQKSLRGFFKANDKALEFKKS